MGIDDEEKRYMNKHWPLRGFPILIEEDIARPSMDNARYKSRHNDY